MTATYRTKPIAPVTVEARQYTHESEAEALADWVEESGDGESSAWTYTGDSHGHTDPPWQHHTCINIASNDDYAAFLGYWIVRYPSGSFAAFSPEDFAAKFETTEES